MTTVKVEDKGVDILVTVPPTPDWVTPWAHWTWLLCLVFTPLYVLFARYVAAISMPAGSFVWPVWAMIAGTIAFLVYALGLDPHRSFPITCADLDGIL